ncbi:MAG: hypothetical protein AB7F19_04375 [Candidatus Babeliales bacterium]
MQYSCIQTLLFLIFLLSIQASNCLYQPVAIHLADQEENPYKSEASLVDPILTDFAINVQQQHASLITSRQFVHRLIRYQEQSAQDQLNTSTRLYAFCKSLASLQSALGLSPVTTPSISFTLYKANEQSGSTPSLIPPHIRGFLRQYPDLLTYFFISQVPLSRWQIFQVINPDTRTITIEPFYVLLPPNTVPSKKKNSKKKGIRLSKVLFSDIHQQALNESQATQHADYGPIPAWLVHGMLKALQKKLTSDPQQKSSLIISLTGHGKYTRSQFGVVADRMQPSTLKAVPRLDQYKDEEKDTHGRIACLTVQEFRKLLLRLDKDASTAFLHYDSCHSGGQHLVLPYMHEDDKPIRLNFPTVSRCIDSGVSALEFFHLGTTMQDPIVLTCPIDPKSFFEKVVTWCKVRNDTRENNHLKPAFLAMIGKRERNNVCIRDAGAVEFVPLLTPQHRAITHLNTREEQFTFKKKRHDLFLGHNRISQPIQAIIPRIRSCIPTNCAHFIKELNCTDPQDRAPSDLLTKIFFHKHNLSSLNRLIFFIKTFRLTTQGKTHTLHDFMIMQHPLWGKTKNSFALWRNPKTPNGDRTYTLTCWQNAQSKLGDLQKVDPVKARQALLYYLALDPSQHSYLEVPSLFSAAPHAFDDTAIKEHCINTLKSKEHGTRAILKVWRMLDM